MAAEMATKHKEEHEESAVQQECCHYWLIEMAAGPISKGVCKFCSAQKEYKNYLPDRLEADEKGYRGIRKYSRKLQSTCSR